MLINDQYDEDIMIDMKLLKIIGLYQILSSNTVKLFGYNIYRFISVIQLIIYLMALIVIILNLYYYTNDIFGMANYFILVANYLLASVKIYNIIKNADRFWSCIQSTSVKYLSYKYHNNRTLQMGRTKSKLFSMFFIFSWIAGVVGWFLSPYFIRTHKLEVKVNNETYYYRYGIINLIYPVTDQFYNDHYLSYYIMEMTLGILWCHSTLIFDVLTISICVTLSYQLKTIANSYSSFGDKHNHTLTISMYLKINYKIFKKIIYR